jgi:glyoxylase-like metal-dependent hydrolase (beta-lactamase superfamily II)
MVVLKACGGIAQTNCWLVADEAKKKAVLFDAPNDTTSTLLDEAEQRGWDVVGLWLTHGHFDHLADHAVVTARFPKAKVLLHAGDLDKITGKYPIIFPLPFKIPTREPDGLLEDGQSLSIGSIPVEVIHTPGHAAGHVVFHLPQDNLLIGGDMIIQGSIGRTDLPDSDLTQMRESLKRIMELPEETTLLPGHGSASTLMRELHHNCVLQDVLEDR